MSNQQIKQLAGVFAEKIKTYQERHIRDEITTQDDLEDAVEEQIDVHLGGLDLLFLKNEVATSPADWAKLATESVEARYVLKNLGEIDEAMLAAVRAVKDKHREQLLSNLANNLIYATTDIEPYSVENLKQLMNDGGAYLEEADDEVLEKIFNKTVGQTDTGPKIGLDPDDPTDQQEIYDHYQTTGGVGELGQLLTVCTKAEKHGGTYTYGEVEYQMFHDSHGPSGANSNLSVTAWKILVSGRLQVVGVGHHVSGSAQYEAIFPFSTNAASRTVGPSPDVVHQMG